MVKSLPAVEENWVQWVWLPTPVFLPGKFHVQRSVEGYSPWGPKELDTPEQLTLRKRTHPFPNFLPVYHLLLTVCRFSPPNLKMLWAYQEEQHSTVVKDSVSGEAQPGCMVWVHHWPSGWPGVHHIIFLCLLYHLFKKSGVGGGCG